jgi:hypothetical protein
VPWHLQPGDLPDPPLPGPPAGGSDSEGSDMDEAAAEQGGWLHPWVQNEFGADLQQQVGHRRRSLSSLLPSALIRLAWRRATAGVLC